MKNRIVELIRLEENELFGTFGILKINKEAYCVTLEPADELNAQNISSIPAQQYTCYRVQSPKFGNTFEVSNVPNRTKVLFHAGNTIEHTHGCILLAEHFGKLHGNGTMRAVLNSGETFKHFNETIMRDVDSFHLTIREVY